MATASLNYAAKAGITCSMASKTSGQGQRSASISNSTNLYVNAHCLVSLTVGTVTNPATFTVYGYASADEATNFESGGSTDAAWNTLRGDEKWLCTVACPTSSTAYAGVFDIASAWYGGMMPRDWGIIISQTNCGTLSATEGNHIKQYIGLKLTIA